MSNYPQNVPYIRVGKNYYKRIQRPLLSGDAVECLVDWSLDVIKQDFGRQWHEVFSKIPRYDGFITFPEHQNYQRDYKGFYNQYEPLPQKPKEGDYKIILSFLEHIFGDQLHVGLDYLTILYKTPVQILPVLCLISKERSTGKTTFLNLLKKMFGANMTYNNNDDFRSNFNSEWVSKLIIAVDEVLLDRREDSEKIKNLSTAQSYKAEGKGQNRAEVEYFGKIILCSNNEDDFIFIDRSETRYWVRKIEPLKTVDPSLSEKMIRQIPAFLFFIKNRTISTQKTSRMWFSPEEISTKALLRVKNRFANKIETELIEIIKELFEGCELDEFHFTNKDAIELLRSNNVKATRTQVKKIIDSWQLKISANAFNYKTYKYDYSGITYEALQKGRFYSMNKDDINKIMLQC